MSVHRAPVPAQTWFAAVCDGCGKRGPERRSEPEAIESVTCEATGRAVGFVMADHWSRMGDRLSCRDCRDAALVAAVDEPPPSTLRSP